MLQLDSNKYTGVNVHLRDETITMPVENGLKLMSYLTGDNTSSHVMVTDKQGIQTVLNKNDIRKVAPIVKREEVNKLNMPDLTGDFYDNFKLKR